MTEPAAAAKACQRELFIKNHTCNEEPGLEGDFPGREKQDVFPAASRDGFTAARKVPF